MTIRAFQTTLWEVKSIVFAATASQARYTTFKEAHGAGYRVVSFGEIKARRRSDLDGATLKSGAEPKPRVGYIRESLVPRKGKP